MSDKTEAVTDPREEPADSPAENQPERDADQQDDAPAPDVASPKLGGWLLAIGLVVSAACLIWLSVIAGELTWNPLAMRGLLGTVILALVFQIGFVLCACGLAAIGRPTTYLYLPVVLVCFIGIGLVSGFVSYLVTSAPSDYKYLKPRKAEYGWSFSDQNSGLRDCSVTYTKQSFMPGGQGGKSTMRISVPRRLTPPMTDTEWRRHLAMMEEQRKSLEKEQRRSTRHESKKLTIAGQRAYKIVSEMRNPQGPGVTTAFYYWYSPVLGRRLMCMVTLLGGGAWELETVEKMLNSVPVK